MVVASVNVGSSSVRLGAHRREGAELREAFSSRAEGEPAPALRRMAEKAAGCAAVVHRVVHGGHRREPRRIDGAFLEDLEALTPLAPLHTPPVLQWIREARRVFPEVPHIAVFDTAFTADLPEEAALYALPRGLCRQHGIRRYGFHGLAHGSLWRQWRRARPDLEGGGRVVSFQLGSGCSACAVSRGRAIDTSMGFTPLEGLVMATRPGDLDPGLLTYLLEEGGMELSELSRVLRRESGLRGLSGRTSRMEELLDSSREEDRLAVAVYCLRARKYLGAYLALLEGADGILFGGGVGENAPEVRQRILAGMGWCGIRLDPEANREPGGRDGRISASDSPVEVRVFPVDEAREMVLQALPLLEVPT